MTHTIATHTAQNTLRLGRIKFLNVFPMHWALDVEPTLSDVPSAVNDALVAGSVDVGCVSSIHYARHADSLRLLPSMCISADGAVGSIFAITSSPLAEITKVYATPASRTSVALLDILIREAGGEARFETLANPAFDDAARMALSEPGAAVLLIGDDAMRARQDATLASQAFVDLGAAWTEMTGLPMVYAVWAVRDDAAERDPLAALDFDAQLRASVEAFAASDDGVERAAAGYDLDPEAVRDYFDGLSYAFGPRERAGLLEYLRLAVRHGQLDAAPTLRFVQAPDDDGASVPGTRPTLDLDEDCAAYARAVNSKAPFTERPEDALELQRALDTEAAARELDVDSVLDKALRDERIDEVEATALLLSGRLVDVGDVANVLRERRTPADEITFIVDRNINYTNLCVTDCGFCAFFRSPGANATDEYLQSTDEILERIQETVDLGGTAALLQGGHNPDLDIRYYVDLFTAIKERFPEFHLHALSPPEIQHIARRSKLRVGDVLATLRDAGLDSLPGGGAEMLVERVRRILAPKKTKTDDWLSIMREAQGIGMSTTATMMYGHVDLIPERIFHMQRIRELQDETHGFRAFVSWTFQRGDTPLAKLLAAGKAPHQDLLPPEPTPFDYLLTQAVSRIYLDNVDNIQSSWVTQGMKVGQVALLYGANDLGSIMIEENVVSSAGTTYRASTEDFVAAISGLGKTAVQRDTLYRTVRIHDR